jgi:hypothetical protein
MMTIDKEQHMNKTNTGGPAFARPASPAHEYGFHKHQEGMTLRDYFAAKAMQAILGRTDSRFTTDLAFVGGKAYQYADAMLSARGTEKARDA